MRWPSGAMLSMTDLVTLVSVSLLLVAVIVAATTLPARTAMRTNLLNVIRNE